MLACRCRTIQSKRGKKVKDVSKQQKIRMAADMLMVILLPLLMAYSLIGESLHEWFGIVMFAVFFFHHFLNWRWYKNLTKGSYTIRRIVLTITNGLLLMLMIALPVSGMFMASLSSKRKSHELQEWIKDNEEMRIYCSYNNKDNTYDYPAMLSGVTASGANKYIEYKPNDCKYNSNRIVIFNKGIHLFYGNSYLSIETLLTH